MDGLQGSAVAGIQAGRGPGEQLSGVLVEGGESLDQLGRHPPVVLRLIT
ncbi:hypothetical protein [Streptomyces sp. V1I1]|nr:hypothetical protein [Streptomyces sp. V1I1]MDQ0945593.1 hypothetical protein [Streptomyces sp. V1I1]